MNAPFESRSGYRGYVGARPIFGNRTPQHVQNIVIREYAARHRLAYKLSATEYAMPSSYIMLQQVLGELPRLEGVILYSMFMLPQRPDVRASIYETFRRTGAILHAAVEGLAIRDADDARRFEDIWRVQQVMARGTLRGDDISHLSL
jgi:sporadic carbohydrate cluster protein (TIGR04323 family)